MEAVVCDKCGASVPVKTGDKKFRLVVSYLYATSSGDCKSNHLCGKCYDEYQQWLGTQPVAEESEKTSSTTIYTAKTDVSNPPRFGKFLKKERR